MDLLINTAALDKSAAAVGAAATFLPLTGPDDFPQLVLGTTEPITLKFLSAASTFETWSDSLLYTMAVSIGRKTPTGLLDFADATLATVITNGKSGSLALTGSRIADEMRFILACCSNWNRTDVILTLQVKVTDPSGNVRCFAQIPVQVNGKVA